MPLVPVKLILPFRLVPSMRSEKLNCTDGLTRTLLKWALLLGALSTVTCLSVKLPGAVVFEEVPDFLHEVKKARTAKSHE